MLDEVLPNQLGDVGEMRETACNNRCEIGNHSDPFTVLVSENIFSLTCKLI